MPGTDEHAAKRVKLGDGTASAVAPEPQPQQQQQSEPEREPFTVPAEEVMTLCLVERPERVLEAAGDSGAFEWFAPTFTHQVFGQDEVVRGYESCRVRCFLHASTMHAYVEISHEGKQPKADDIGHLLRENLGLEYTEDKGEFVRRVKETERALERSLSNYATSCRRFSVRGGKESETPVEVVRFKPSEGDAEPLRKLHDRLQFMPLLYVDGANYIDNEDPKWDIYLALAGPGGTNRAVAGFCTVYSFYAYPERRRLRLSQILVLPPFQRRGLASRMLEQVYADAAGAEALDLTVEDPSEEFQQLRESVDVRRVRQTSDNFYVKAVETLLSKCRPMLENGIHADTLLLPTKDVYDKAERELKIHRAQLRKIWEHLLRLAGLDRQALEQVVAHRVSSEVSEKRLWEGAKSKHLFNFNNDNFIMTSWNFTRKKPEEDPKAKEEDLERIQRRMQQLAAK